MISYDIVSYAYVLVLVCTRYVQCKYVVRRRVSKYCRIAAAATHDCVMRVMHYASNLYVCTYHTRSGDSLLGSNRDFSFPAARQQVNGFELWSIMLTFIVLYDIHIYTVLLQKTSVDVNKVQYSY